MPRAERVNVQRTLAFVGFFYFVFSIGKACLFPYLTIYFRYLGLSATQTGIILGLKPFAALLATPFWIHCAIKHNKRRVILMTAILTMIGANLGLTLIPPIEQEAAHEFCQGGKSQLTNKSDGQNYAISPLINKIEHIVFHDKSKEGTTTPATTPPVATPVGPPESSSTQTDKVPEVTVKNSPHSDEVTVPDSLTTGAVKSTTSKIESSNDKPNAEHDNDKTGAESEAHHSDSIPNAEESPKKGDKDEVTPNDSETENSDDDDMNKEEYQKAIKDYLSKLLGDTLEDNDNADTTKRDAVQKKHAISKRHGGEPEYNWKPSKTQEVTSKTPDADVIKSTMPFVTNKPEIEKEETTKTLGADSGNENSAPADASADTSDPEIVKVKDETARQVEFITYMTVLVIVILGEIFASPADKICDDALYETLDHLDEVDKYGRHHLVSLIGMGIGAVAVGIGVHYANCEIFLDANRIMIHFYAFAVLCGISFLLAFCYPMQDTGKTLKYDKLFRGLVLLLTDFNNIMVVITLLLIGFVSASIQNFMFWAIQDLGGSEIVMGLTVAVSAIAEMPTLFASGLITRKVGHMGVLGLASLALSARLLYFSYLWNPWAAIPIEILNIFCKGALWESAMMYAEHAAPPGMQRTMQVVMVVIYYGIGSSNGSTISGLIYEHYGRQTMFLCFSIVALFWAAVLFIYAMFVPKKRKLHYSKILRDEEDNNNDEDDDIFDSSDDEDDWLVNALRKDKF